MRAVVVAAGLAATPAVPAVDAGMGFEVVVGLTAKAAERLSRSGERIVVSAWYYADPKPGAEMHANPVGLIDVGVEDIVIGSLGGPVTVTGAAVRTEALGWIGGQVHVNVNVFTARLSGPDNLLDCDFFDGLLTRAAAGPLELRCGLFEEDIPVKAKS